MLLTVLMTVYNGERFLGEAIASILGQTFGEYEFLIINDGSTDSTSEILNSFIKRDRRIRIIKNSYNLGLAKSLNIGLTQSRGELIARMDADDVSLSRRLEIQYEFMQKNPQVGLVSTCYELIDSNGMVLGKKSKSWSSEDIYYHLFFSNMICHSSVMYRKDKVIGINGYNERVCVAQDYELWGRLVRKTRFHQINQILVQWRKSNHNISARMYENQKRITEEFALARIKSLVGVGLSSKDFHFLQSPSSHNTDFFSFRGNLKLLKNLNKMILDKERDVLVETGLVVFSLKRTMDFKLRELLYIYLREKTDNRLKDFFRLNTCWKYLVIVEVVQRILKKMSDQLSWKKSS